MVDITSINQQIVSKITSSVSGKGSAFATSIGWALLVLAVIALGAGYFWYRLEKKKYNKKIIANSIINGYFQPSYRDVAKSVRIGRGGFEVLYVKKLKTWKIAQGARSGMNEYTFYILPDGYWYPGQISANIFQIDKLKGLIPVISTNSTMRSQYTSLEKQIEMLHGQKQSFWDKYGNWVLSGAYIAIIGIFCWLSFREISSFLGAGSELAAQMNALGETMNKLAINLNNAQPSGLVQG